MSNTTIVEDYLLPSLGKIYGEKFDPHVRIRSMTVAEEMKRLTPTDMPYKTMCSIIDDCLETKLPISVYDMCIGDYQYLLHKLRVVTYGNSYTLTIRCPFCGSFFDHTINLDEQKVHEYDDSMRDLLSFTLPVTGKTITIGMQTPSDLDRIEQKKKQLKKDFPDMKDDPTLMLNLSTIIKSIDGEPVNPITIDTVIKNLPMKDSNKIIRQANKLNGKVGVDINILGTCPDCKNDVLTTFRYTSEFFRPTDDE